MEKTIKIIFYIFLCMGMLFIFGCFESSPTSTDSIDDGDNNTNDSIDDGDNNTNKTIPNAPEGVYGSTAHFSQIEIFWNLVSDATKYNIYRATSGTGIKSKISTATSSPYTDVPDSAGFAYYYWITSENSAGESDYSDRFTGFRKTGSGASGAPTGLEASTNDYSKIDITWQSVSGASEYNIYRSTSNSGTKTKITTTSELRFSDNTGSAGVAYYYFITAVIDGIESGYSCAVAGSRKYND